MKVHETCLKRISRIISILLSSSGHSKKFLDYITRIGKHWRFFMIHYLTQLYIFLYFVFINFVQPLNMWCMLLVVIMRLKSTSVIKHAVIKRHCALNTCTIVLCRHTFWKSFVPERVFSKRGCSLPWSHAPIYSGSV